VVGKQVGVFFFVVGEIVGKLRIFAWDRLPETICRSVITQRLGETTHLEKDSKAERSRRSQLDKWPYGDIWRGCRTPIHWMSDTLKP
jgi:hypothetical protein